MSDYRPQLLKREGKIRIALRVAELTVSSERLAMIGVSVSSLSESSSFCRLTQPRKDPIDDIWLPERLSVSK